MTNPKKDRQTRGLDMKWAGVPKDLACYRCGEGTKADNLCLDCLRRDHYWLKKFEEAVLKRMAHEPQHSRLDHECGICVALADLRHARARRG